MIGYSPVASANELLNGSFESGLTGWVATGNVLQLSDTSVPVSFPATDGHNMANFNAGNTTPNGTLSQSFVTLTGQKYTIAFDFGNWGNFLPVTQGLRVTLQGTGVLDQRDVTDSTIDGTQNAATVYNPFSYNFTADSVLTTLTFADIANGTSGSDGLLDNVRITPVPEPATMGLVICGAIALMARHWRRVTLVTNRVMRSGMCLSLGALMIFLGFAPVSRANLLTNGSFESPVLPAGKAVIDPVGNAWTFTHPSGLISPPGEPVPGQGDYGGYPAPDGNQYAFIQSGGGSRGTISQQITLPTTGDYRLTYWEAGRPHQNFSLPTGGNQPYSILLDSTVLGTFATTTDEPFTARSLDFTASAGTYTFKFAAGGVLTADNTSFIDGVNLVSIPEPSMLAAGILGSVMLLRPRRKQ